MLNIPCSSVPAISACIYCSVTSKTNNLLSLEIHLHERLQLIFCKRQLGVNIVHKTTLYMSCLEQNMRYYNVIKFWIKISHINNDKYVRQVYNALYQETLAYHNKKNWCSLIKQSLCTLGFHDEWVFHTVGNSGIFLLTVEQRLKHQFLKKKWSNRLSESSRALFYRNIAKYFSSTLFRCCQYK